MAATPTTKVIKKKKPLKWKSFNQREFLNLPNKSSAAYISARVSSEKYQDDYEIIITDCNNTIRLHGNLKSLESRKNAINKINTLEDTLAKMRNHLIQEFAMKDVNFQ